MIESRSSTLRLLKCDQHGAIMIIGVGMGIFLVAMLYYLIGIGDAVLYREHLQDASDAAALSSALMHARGMNYIVFLNLVMEALVAVLLILNVIMTLLKIAILALTAAAPFTFGSTAGLAAALANVHQGVESVYQPTESVVMTTLTTLHKVSDAVRIATPVVATLGTLIEVNSHLQPPAQFAFVVPTRLKLPVEPDRYSVLCERAAGDVADFAMQYMPEKARSLVHGAATGIARMASGWLCGASDGPPPSYEEEQHYWHPSPEGYESCQRDPEAALTNPDEASRCEQLREQQKRNAPDEHGDCAAGEDCSIDGPYEKMLTQARTQCKPDPSKALVDYRWQQKTISATYEWTGSTWILTDQDAEPGRIMPSADNGAPLPPCGDQIDALGKDWRETVHPGDDVTNVINVCEEDYQKQLPDTGALQPGYHYPVRYEAVTQILGCSEIKRIRVPIGVSGASPTGGSGSGKEPFRVEHDIDLGGEAFQMRALAIGSGLNPLPENVMKLAVAGRCDGPNAVECASGASIATELSRFSAAQAEYFYNHDGSEAREEWMWNMKWRARLVRLRPFDSESNHSGDPAPNPTSLCSALSQGSDCNAPTAALSSLANLTVH